MKKILRIFIVTILLFFSCNVVSADVPSVSNTENIFDFAGVLKDSEIQSLSSELKRISSKYGLDVLILTTKDTGGMDTRDYADDFYDHNNFKDDGVILVIDFDNYNMYISTAGKCIDYFTDYGIDYIFDNIQDLLSNGQYYKAFKRFTVDAEYLIQEGLVDNIIDTDNEPKRFGVANFSISAIIASVVSGISALVFKGQLRSVATERFARNYVVDNSFVLTGMSDMLVNKSVTRHPRRSSSSSSGRSSGPSGGGSSIHTSSSGTTHGGHGRGF